MGISQDWIVIIGGIVIIVGAAIGVGVKVAHDKHKAQTVAMSQGFDSSSDDNF